MQQAVPRHGTGMNGSTTTTASMHKLHSQRGGPHLPSLDEFAGIVLIGEVFYFDLTGEHLRSLQFALQVIAARIDIPRPVAFQI